MYSDNFVQHMFEKANELINIERRYIFVLNSKRQRAHEKLDYNLKRLLDHIPKELKDLSVEQFLNEYSGDLDLAASQLVKVETPAQNERMYESPPKN